MNEKNLKSSQIKEIKKQYKSVQNKKLVKAIISIIGLSLFYFLKDVKLHHNITEGSNKFDFALDVVFNHATKYLTQNLVIRNFLIIYSSLMLDSCFTLFMILYLYKGKGWKEPLAFGLFYGIRAIFLNLFDFDYPPMNFYENEHGFGSWVAPHVRSSDYFYSGHTGFSFLCCLFFREFNHDNLFISGALVTILQIYAILISRCHYIIDATIGLVMSHYAYLICPIYGKIFNIIIPVHED